MTDNHAECAVIARKNGLKPATFHNRVRRGWHPYRAATTPARGYHYEWKGACA